jgi:nitroreductase
MDMDERIRFIFGRRSIRAYTSEVVGDETIRRLLEAAMAAPSAAASDPWRFVVIKNRGMLMKLTQVLPHGQMLASAALGIVVSGDLEAAHDHQLSYLLQDCAAAIENLLLCAHLLGLGACWLGVHPRENRVKSLQTLLKLQNSVIPIACIAVGYAAESKEPRTRFNPNYVRFEN